MAVTFSKECNLCCVTRMPIRDEGGKVLALLCVTCDAPKKAQ
jgi:transcriptional regulator of acetoin/glycerol metabolism